jgi:hypothetical protein
MNALHTSGVRGHEYVSPEKDSKSQKALYPYEYFAHVDLANAELTREEKVLQLTVESSPFMAISGSGMDCILNLFAPVYLSNLCPGGEDCIYQYILLGFKMIRNEDGIYVDVVGCIVGI